MITLAFTNQQIKNWQAYERVRESAWFNMFDQKAMQATGLSSDEYTFVMENFEALKKQATDTKN